MRTVHPGAFKKLGPLLNIVVNTVLVLVIVLVLVKIAPTFTGITPWLLLASSLLAIVCIGTVRLLVRADVPTARTLAIYNANRFVGLALRWRENRCIAPM